MAESTADYIIVGGGLTGCVIASRLSRSTSKPSVVLIKAGGSPASNAAASGYLSGLSLLGGEFDYAYTSEPTPSTLDRTHKLPTGKALGGSTIINFGGWLRADAKDYDDWAEMVGDKKWSYQGLKPWLRSTETFHDAEADGDTHGFRGPNHVYSVSAVEAGKRKYPLREPVKEA